MTSTEHPNRIRAIAAAVAVALAVSAVGCGAGKGQTPRVITADCPAVLPGTSNANEDFADMLVWQARTYINTGRGVLPADASSGPVRPGSEVGEVTCSLVDGPLSGVGERLVNPPWPDGTATGLPQGTAIYAVRGRPTACVLAARRGGSLVSYVAIDTTDNGWPPLC